MTNPALIFTPNSVPSQTYVIRTDQDYELLLRRAIAIPNAIVAVSGPSKCGKTVLINKIVGKDNLIPVNGASIKEAGDLWRIVLNWIGEPIEVQKTDKFSADAKVGGKIVGEVGTKLLAKGKVEGDGSVGGTISREVRKTFQSEPLSQIAREIAGSDYTIFIDDFHYVNKDVQSELAREIKAIAEMGVRICIASVPHRADDAVRGNNELRGRVQAINIQYWSAVELEKIAIQGFRALRTDINVESARLFAKECFWSPQFMQSVCLQAAFAKCLDKNESPPSTLSFSEDDRSVILERTSASADYTSLIEALHAGPKIRGNERKEFDFMDGSTGDVYRSILIALKRDPAKLTFPYQDVFDRVRAVCVSEASPVGSSIQNSLEKMAEKSSEFPPKVLDWDDNVFDIIDPYFMFFLRFSPVLAQLAANNSE